MQKSFEYVFVCDGKFTCLFRDESWFAARNDVLVIHESRERSFHKHLVVSRAIRSSFRDWITRSSWKSLCGIFCLLDKHKVAGFYNTKLIIVCERDETHTQARSDSESFKCGTSTNTEAFLCVYSRVALRKHSERAEVVKLRENILWDISKWNFLCRSR